MKLRIEADEGELEAKAPEVLEALAKALEPYAPGAAGALVKAMADVSTPVVEPLEPALRDFFHDTRTRYQLQMEKMLQEIGAALDERVAELAAENSK